MTLQTLFELAVARHASDIHLVSGEAPRLRIDGALVPLEGVADLPTLLEPLLTSEGVARLSAGSSIGPTAPLVVEAVARLSAGLPVERTLIHGDLAFVAIVFRVGENGLAATFRIISNRIPPLDVIGEGALPLFERLKGTPRGLVLITGPTGSGKWTTACSLVDAINAETPARIFVVEAHPGFRFESKKGMATQIHVGQDCDSYLRALDIAHHADPDVIAIDDLPTYEVLRRALSLADLGHLVVTNLHAKSAVDAMERLVESAGDEVPAMRRALADSLLAVTGQRLLSRVGGGKVPVYEWIVNTPTVKEAVLNGGLARAQFEDPECRTVDVALAELRAARKIE